MEREKFLSSAFEKSMSAYEGYETFLNRILSFQKSEFYFGVETFFPSNSVKSKVQDDSSFSRFIGDTVVFNLKSSQKKFIFDYYITPLYQVASDCLAERLQEHTLHMTLHDLNATDAYDLEVMKNIFKDELLISRMIEKFAFKTQEIKMVTTAVFNMVNTSFVLGLRPKTEEDYEKLMHLYCCIDGIHSLPYPFTPHITLAYFNRNSFDGEKLQAIQQVVNELNKESFEISISTKRLFYQKFISMNDYFNIIPFIK